MNQNVIIWLDLETSGLNPDTGRIFEVAIIVTNWDLVELERNSWVIGCPQDQLPTLDPPVYRMHTTNGLLAEVVAKQDSTLSQVEYNICVFLVKYISDGSKFLLGGNSIAFDRLWIKKHLRLLDQLLHHRLIDVTPFGLLIERWCSKHHSKMRGTFGSNVFSTQHRAMDDIEKSIKWMSLYKSFIFDRIDELAPLDNNDVSVVPTAVPVNDTSRLSVVPTVTSSEPVIFRKDRGASTEPTFNLDIGASSQSLDEIGMARRHKRNTTGRLLPSVPERSGNNDRQAERSDRSDRADTSADFIVL
jgi:oligoribonuclease